MAITRTFIASRDPYGLCFSSFSINLNSLKTQWNVKCYKYLYSFVAFSCCLIWCECCLVVCFIFSLLPPSVWKCDFVLWSLRGGGKHWKCVDVCKWAQRLMCWMFDMFPLKVCVWMCFYVLWIKGKSEIKLNLTRYDTLLTVTYFWLYINWTANTLIHMYRDLGHGQPRCSSESRLDSVMEKLKTVLGGPAQTNIGIAARLP